ncbi:YceI family protein [Sinomicrobium weinanense]|uniref:YceI family protein n=1 Tax=Sinomicrobium weinanense TaxID=2842200 RepID=A0A926JQZ4_9FLAO|nr:YceI family protein [Sinomicrobium weinanense]MBC9795678.1 YceI family protein [Sinomicrobium weinanense]MBU3122847.1 YceI family protein [Sinomicrobium weinanense]
METTANKVTWSIDPAHSEVQFKVKHLVISTVTGQFTSFSGGLETNGEGFDNAKAVFEVDIDSISTNNNDRDNHLKSADFFDAENHPKLIFVSTGFKKTGDDTYEVTGDITIRGNTKPIVLKAEHGGTMVDPYGNTKAGFEITGKLNRKEFGLEWNGVTEAGGIVVGDEVKLLLNLQFARN